MLDGAARDAFDPRVTSRQATLLSASFLLLLTACGCGDDDDDSLGDGDADGDSDNEPPTLTADPELPDTIRQAGLLSTTLTAVDPEGDALTWTVRSPESGATLDEATGALTVRVPIDASGTVDVAVDVSDGTATATYEHSATVEPLAWEEIAPAWDPQTFTATAVDEAGRVTWQVGGFGQTRAAIVMRHDLATNEWSRVRLAGDPMPPLMAAGACWSAPEQKIIVVGGFLGHLPREYPRNAIVYVIDPSTDPAQVHALGGDQTLEAVFPRLVCHPTASEAMLVGTFGLDGPDMTPYRISLGAADATIETLSPADMPPARAYFGIVPRGTQAVLFGGDENPGEASTNFDDVWTIDLDTGEYAEVVAADGPSRRAYAATALAGDTLVVAGGLEPGGHPAEDVWYLDLVAPAWTAADLTGDDLLPFFTQAWAYDATTSTMHLYAPSLQDPDRGLLTDARDVTLVLDPDAAAADFVMSDPAPGQGPRRRFAALVGIGGDRYHLVVHGGSTAILSSGNALDDSWRLDLEDPEWEPIGNEGEGPGAVQGAAFIQDDRRRLLSIGGYDGQSPEDALVFAYDPDDGDWRALETTGDAPGVRVGACGAWNDEGGAALFFGGLPDEGFAKTWELQAGSAAGTWRQIDAEGPAARGFGACAYDLAARRLIIYGGEDPGILFQDAWALDLSDAGNESWSELEPSGEGPGALTDMAFAVDPVGRKLVMMGGTTGLTSLGDVWMLDMVPGAEAWLHMPWDPTGPEVRRAAGATYHAPSGAFVLYGGRVLDPGLALLGDVWRLAL